MSEQTSIPADPELDPTASYATDQSVIRRLSGLLRATAGTRTSYAPATGQPIADLPVSSPDDVIAAVRSARKTQQTWRRVPLAERAAILLRYHDLVLDHRHELVDLVIRESGKARKQAFEEVAHVALTARYYGRKAAELPRAAAQARHVPDPDPGRAAVRPEGCRRHHLAVELPAQHGDGRRPARGAGRQHGRAQARQPDPADRAARAIELLYEAGLPAGRLAGR